MNISLGAFAKPISVQIGIQNQKTEVLDLDADAITRLRIRGYLTDSVLVSVHKKLIKNIEKVAL